MSKLHFIPSKILNSNDKITINIIGAGGTGSAFIKELISIVGLIDSIKDKQIIVTLYDSARIKESNLWRQNFYPEDVGSYKAETLIKRINRNYNFNWKYVNENIKATHVPEANFTVLCVDNIKARQFVYNNKFNLEYIQDRDRAFYILDLGNDRFSGQIFLSTIAAVKQPKVDGVETISTLKNVNQYFGKKVMIHSMGTETNIPSCSSYEAILSQDLFINKAIAMHGARMIWNMLLNGFIEVNAYFINHETENFKALKV